MRVMVTGGAGFFGANLVRCLAASAGAEEVVCADLALPDEVTARYLAPVAERVRAVQLDVTDRTAFIRLVRELGITHLVHAAAITPDDAQERAQPDAVVDINLGGSTNALAALAACPGLERLLLVSSSGVYGAAEAGKQAARRPAQPERRRPLAPGQPVRRHQTLRRAAGGTLCGDRRPSGRRRAAGSAVRPIWNGPGAPGRTPRRSIDWPWR